MKVCKKCYSTYEEDKAFCRRCGGALVAPQEVAAEHRSRGDAWTARRKFRAAAREYAGALGWQPDDPEARARYAAARRAARKKLAVALGGIAAVAVAAAGGWALAVTGLRVQLDPALQDYSQDLQVLLDGKPIVWWEQRRILIGAHRLQALNPRYRDFVQEFAARPLRVVDLVLRAAPKAGDLRIESTPPGAAVWVNGEVRGETPLDVHGVRVPSATVRVQKRHFTAKQETIQVSDLSTVTLTYQLERSAERPAPPLSREILSSLFPPQNKGDEVTVDRVEKGAFTEPGAAEALVQVARGWPELWLISADDGRWTTVRKIIEPRGLEFRVVDVENDGRDEVWIETSECHQGDCYFGYELRGLSAQGDRTLFKAEDENDSGATLDFTGEATELLSDFVDIAENGEKALVLVTLTDTYSKGDKTGQRSETAIYVPGEAGLIPANPNRFPAAELAQAPSGERLRAAVQLALPAIAPILFPQLRSCRDHTVRSAVPVWGRRVEDEWLVTARVNWTCVDPSPSIGPRRPLTLMVDRLVSVLLRSRADGALALSLPASAKGRGASPSKEKEPPGAAPSQVTTAASSRTAAPPPRGAGDRPPIDLGAPFDEAFDDGAARVRALVTRIAGTLPSLTEAKLLDEIAAIETLPRPLSRKSASARKLNEEGIKAAGARDFARAIAIFQSAYADNPTDVEIVENLGYAHLSAGSLDKAEFYVTLSTLMVPRRATSWNNLGEIHALRGDLDGATGCLALAYSVSRSKDVTRRFYDKLSHENPSEQIRTVAQRVLQLVAQHGFSTGEPAVAGR